MLGCLENVINFISNECSLTLRHIFHFAFKEFGVSQKNFKD